MHALTITHLRAVLFISPNMEIAILNSYVAETQNKLGEARGTKLHKFCAFLFFFPSVTPPFTRVSLWDCERKQC